MNPASSAKLKYFRLIGLAEAISFLVLLFIGVPLKWLAGQPQLVKILGPIHGGLFLLYVLAAILTAIALRWRWPCLVAALAASVFPFGPFLFDAHLRRESATS